MQLRNFIAENKKKPDRKILALLIVAGTVSVLSVTYLTAYTSDEISAYDVPSRALILDQLYDEIPNKSFHSTATEYLESAGYTVDIVTTKEITIDFYKKLPEMNYDFVVIRTHGVVDKSDNKGVALFTGEKYSEDKYVLEQLMGIVKKGTPLIDVTFQQNEQESRKWVQTGDNQFESVTKAEIIDESADEYFLISSEFVEQAMEGDFSNTIFFLGGCETMADSSLADSLVNRGGQLVVGWDNPVGSYENDKIMLQLIQNYIVEGLDIQKAVEASQNIPLEYMTPPSSLAYQSAEILT